MDGATPEREGATRRGPKVIHAGYMRTGTASMTDAYRTLGYRVHHGMDDVFGSPWASLERAAEATFPSLAKLPGYTYGHGSEPRPPFTRENWDRLWDGYDIDFATDLTAPFVPELITAYPDAKVVIVQRPFETWWPSIRNALLTPALAPSSALTRFFSWNVLGIRVVQAMQKIHVGFFGAPEFSLEAVTEERARVAYEAYYRRIREAVPLESGRRLDYELGQGWEPLCEFLEKEVPDCPFPRNNDRTTMAKSVDAITLDLATRALGRMAVWAVPVAVLLVFVYR